LGFVNDQTSPRKELEMRAHIEETPEGYEIEHRVDFNCRCNKNGARVFLNEVLLPFAKERITLGAESYPKELQLLSQKIEANGGIEFLRGVEIILALDMQNLGNQPVGSDNLFELSRLILNHIALTDFQEKPLFATEIKETEEGFSGKAIEKSTLFASKERLKDIYEERVLPVIKDIPNISAEQFILYLHDLRKLYEPSGSLAPSLPLRAVECPLIFNMQKLEEDKKIETEDYRYCLIAQKLLIEIADQDQYQKKETLLR